MGPLEVLIILIILIPVILVSRAIWKALKRREFDD